MNRLEESLGLDEYIPLFRNCFQAEDEPTLEFQLAEEVLKKLLQDKMVLRRILERLAHDIHFVREQAGNLFNNEVLLWRDPDGCFSLRMNIWTQGSDNFIHDHNAIGITGCWLGKLLVENYEVKENISQDRVKLTLKEKIILEPCQTVEIKIHDYGIHRIDRAEGDFAVGLSVYSRAVPRGYIRKFDLKTGKVSRVSIPTRQQKDWASKLLAIIDQS